MNAPTIEQEKDELSTSHVEDAMAAPQISRDIGMGLPPAPELSASEEARLWRKIDRRLLPMLTLMYLVSFMDRGNIGNAKIQGLSEQLNLTGNQYNIALTMYFIPYCLFECPANLLLKRLRPSRWLPGITVLWGIIMTLMGLVKTYPQLVGARVCLGFAEAGLFPGVIYYLTLWYPRHRLQLRIGIFQGAATLAGAFSGLLAFGISYMSGTAGLLGWSWIFILEGIATVIVGIAAFFVLVDFPYTATFLTPEEQAFVVWRKKYDNSAVGEEEHFSIKHVHAAFGDWQPYLHVLVALSLITPLYGISLFLPTIIKTFGYSSAISNLLTVPPYVFATIMIIVFAAWSDRIQMRFPFILAGLMSCAIGFAINISDAPAGAKYFGTFLCVAGAYSGFPGVVTWLGNNLSGQYKRGVGMALQTTLGNFGGAIASNIYRGEDAPRFILGHALELMFIGIGFITVPLIVLIYTRINRNKARRMAKGEDKALTADELRSLGDRSPDFRYTL